MSTCRASSSATTCSTWRASVGPSTEQLAKFHRENLETLTELLRWSGGRKIASLEAELDDYWEAFDPLFDWSPTEKILRSAGFLRSEVVPRREAVLRIAAQIEPSTTRIWPSKERKSRSRQVALATILIGCDGRPCCSGSWSHSSSCSGFGFSKQRSDEAERQMRELSQQLVNTQEEERKNLSRELHDHVAQVLTGLGWSSAGSNA